MIQQGGDTTIGVYNLAGVELMSQKVNSKLASTSKV